MYGSALHLRRYLSGYTLVTGNYQQEMRMNYELSSGSTSLDVGRLAISFPAPNRNASEVQLRSVSSLFRRPNNRNQIRILVRETTAVVRFAAADQNFPFFYSDRPSFVQSGNKTAIADVRSSGPSTKGLSLRVIKRSAEEMPVTLMDQNV